MLSLFFLNSEAMRLLLRPLVGHTSNYTTQLWSHSCGIFETGSVSPDACALCLPGFHEEYKHCTLEQKMA